MNNALTPAAPTDPTARAALREIARLNRSISHATERGDRVAMAHLERRRDRAREQLRQAERLAAREARSVVVEEPVERRRERPAVVRTDRGAGAGKGKAAAGRTVRRLQATVQRGGDAA